MLHLRSAAEIAWRKCENLEQEWCLRKCLMCKEGLRRLFMMVEREIRCYFAIFKGKGKMKI